MNDTELRLEAIRSAVSSGAKDVVASATAIHTFLTAGNASASTSKPETKTEKPAKVSAQKADETASGQSSDKSAASTETDTPKDKSPSEAASGFSEAGSEITVADIRAAAVKFVGATDNDALVAKLAEFDATNLSSLDPSKYEAFLQSLEVPVASEGVFD